MLLLGLPTEVRRLPLFDFWLCDAESVPALLIFGLATDARRLLLFETCFATSSSSFPGDLPRPSEAKELFLDDLLLGASDLTDKLDFAPL